MAIDPYPMVGFHFLVVFHLFPQMPIDVNFQEVAGLNTQLTFEPYEEGGENRFVHQLPKAVNYDPLVLKRGFYVGSGLTHWCKDALENFVFKPIEVTVTLLNEQHLPLAGWHLSQALPARWSFSPFKAQESAVVIETLELQYQYFTTLKI